MEFSESNHAAGQLKFSTTDEETQNQFQGFDHVAVTYFGLTPLFPCFLRLLARPSPNIAYERQPRIVIMFNFNFSRKNKLLTETLF